MKRVAVIWLALIFMLVPIMGVGCDSDGSNGIESIVAGFSASPDSGDAPLEVKFTDQSTGNITGWEWDFDNDGIIDSTKQNPTYTYSTTENYTVSLTVTGPDGSDTKVEADYINVSLITFVMQAPYMESDASGLALTKFKELIDEKTDGRISIAAYYNGQPVSHTSQFEALQEGTIDMAVQQPGFSRDVNLNFDFSGALAGLIVTKEHYQAVLANAEYSSWYSNLYEASGIKLLGTVDGYRFAGGYFTTFPADSMSDFDGHTIYNIKPGDLEPYEDLLGCSEHVFFEASELISAIKDGQIDIMALPLMHAYWSDLYQAPFFSDYLLRPFYAPYTILINLDKWEAMDSELQEVVEDEVIPELQNYMATTMIYEAKVALKAIVDEMKIDHVHILPASEEDMLYDELVDFAPFTSRAASMNQDMYELITNLRPGNVVWDQDILDVLEYAGLSQSEMLYLIPQTLM